MKKWNTKSKKQIDVDSDIVSILLENRGIVGSKEQEHFLHPQDPYTLTPKDVGLQQKDLDIAITRIQKAIKDNESIIVYADYDADGITAGSVLWETLWSLGANVMPYVPSRFEEGYGFSIIGIDRVKADHAAQLIITVDHGISAHDKVEYAKSLGIDVIVTDHHTKPELLPDCPIIHTTALSGSGVSWFLSQKVLEACSWKTKRPIVKEDLVVIAAIGTIADLVPLVGPSRTLVKYGLEYLNKTQKVGILAILKDANLTQGELSTYDVSHVIAPRLNAMGRLEHAFDALRLLCTKEEKKALDIATKIGVTNKERQQLTLDTAALTIQSVYDDASHTKKRLLFVWHEEFNQGIIGLVAGKLVEEFYLPSVVLTKGEVYSKASARSIFGFNIIDAIRECQDLLVDAGGHPMAAGFTVETKNLELLKSRLEQVAEGKITDDMLVRVLSVDCELPLTLITEKWFSSIQSLAPFGMGNSEPCFVTRGVQLWDVRKIGKEGKHVKFRVSHENSTMLDAVAFGMGDRFNELIKAKRVDIAYTVGINEWNGTRKLQLLIRDIVVLQ
jgi:single-stranded-DNA-specific exonuclease